MKLGIQDIAIATAHHRVSTETLAHGLGIDPAKFSVGLRQTEFSIPALDEDCVTMGATAAAQLLERTGTDGVRTLIFATESAVDQAKSGGVFVHGLLGLPNTIRTIETKQACYAGVGALQLALGIVARNPRERVLVIMSDVARYRVDSPGEPTQGAGAIALMVGADPQVLEVEPVSGVWTADINDFWRPNDLSCPHVDGALSLDAYMTAMVGAWRDYQAQGGAPLAEIDRFVHHQPFTKMALKAHAHLAEVTGVELPDAMVEPSLHYTPRLGNTYTASLFVALLSLLHDTETKAGMRIGFASYGSGSTAEFFSGIIGDGFKNIISKEAVTQMLDARIPLTFDEYRTLHAAHERGSKTEYTNDATTRAPFRFTGVTGGARRYEAN